VKSESLSSCTFGSYNIGGGNPSTWIDTDPLFEIGNSNDFQNTSNALTVLKNGNIGIGTHTPSRILHVKSDANPRILVEAPSDQAPELNLQRGTITHAFYINGNNDLVFTAQVTG